jgi:hypothetical protein
MAYYFVRVSLVFVKVFQAKTMSNVVNRIEYVKNSLPPPIFIPMFYLRAVQLNQ